MKALRSIAMRSTAGALACALAVATLAGCATNPVTGRKQFSLVSPAQELLIGREGHQAVLQEYGIYDNPRLQAYVDSVGQRLAKVSQLPDLQWHFTVIDDPAVNAFALPGGYIYITRGILAHLNSEAQLAGVLGHEIGHVTARHSAQQITNQQLAGLGLTIAAGLSPTFQRYSGTAQTALGLVFLKYSRDNETQADALGVEYATTAGWDPREVPATYATLKRVSDRAGQRLPSYLSTHPDPGDREVRTGELARQAAAGKSGLAIRNRIYLQHIDGIVYGNDPRQGYFVGTHFYHPDLRFEITFPANWKTQNSKSAVVAAEPNNRAAMQLTAANPEGLAPAAFVNRLVQDGKVTRADGGPETIGGFAAWTGVLGVTGSAGNPGTLLATFIRVADTHMFQILGRSAVAGDADASSIAVAARSFRALQDPGRLAAKPDRLRVVAVAKAGTFGEVVGRLGPQAIDLEETAIINNADRGDMVSQGQSLKVVDSGAR